MRKFEIAGYTRITKAQARRLFTAGFPVYACPVNLRPGAPYNPEIKIEPCQDLFDGIVYRFEVYNCINSETGKYSAFYIRDEKTYIHFTFADGSNPYLFWGSVFDCAAELAKWGKHYNITFEKIGFYMLEDRAAVDRDADCTF